MLLLVLVCDDMFICAFSVKQIFNGQKETIAMSFFPSAPIKNVVPRAERASGGEDPRARLGIALYPWGRESCQVPGNYNPGRDQ